MPRATCCWRKCHRNANVSGVSVSWQTSGWYQPPKKWQKKMIKKNVLLIIFSIPVRWWRGFHASVSRPLSRRTQWTSPFHDRISKLLDIGVENLQAWESTRFPAGSFDRWKRHSRNLNSQNPTAAAECEKFSTFWRWRSLLVTVSATVSSSQCLCSSSQSSCPNVCYCVVRVLFLFFLNLVC